MMEGKDVVKQMLRRWCHVPEITTQHWCLIPSCLWQVLFYDLAFHSIYWWKDMVCTEGDLRFMTANYLIMCFPSTCCWHLMFKPGTWIDPVETKSSDTFARPEEGILPRWLWGWNSDNHFWKQPLRLTAYVWWPSLADIETHWICIYMELLLGPGVKVQLLAPYEALISQFSIKGPLNSLRGIEVQSCYFFSLGSWGKMVVDGV